jgi:VanZ family protein
LSLETSSRVAAPAAVFRASTLLAWRVLLALLLALVLLLALTPAPPQSMDLGWDKLNHLMAFTVLALCASMAEPASWRRRVGWLLGLLAYGAAIELLQLLTPGRQGDWADLLADALGIVSGAVLGAALLHGVARRQAR